MENSDIIRRIPTMEDVELVRLLTVNAGDYSKDVLAVAEAEALRRDVPIDSRFIPLESDEPSPVGVGRTFEVRGHRIVCAHAAGRNSSAGASC